MHKPIRRVGILGSGVMGSGIAAHFANAGLSVVLLDIVPPTLSNTEKSNKKARNAFAIAGLEKALKAKPAAFFHKSNAHLIEVGNFEDDFDKLKSCDLVIEAVIEKLDVKQALFAKLEATLNADVIIASNTSGLRIKDMIKGRSESFRKRFLVMHFFNPVRYMKLLELVKGEDTDLNVCTRVHALGENALGKGVVWGKDTPNFVGNRIGVHSLLSTIHLMLEEGLSPEDVDAITGTPMGHPKSASFRTADMVGLDTFVHVADHCYEALTNDEERDVFKVPTFIRTMIERKILGDKTKGGFYRKTKEGIETLEPSSLEYRAKRSDEAIQKFTKSVSKIEDPAERIRALIGNETAENKANRFAWKVLAQSLAYAARRVGEITDDVMSIDNAMKWGYNWELGPFEIWDALGFTYVVDRMQREGIALPASIMAMRTNGATCFYRADGFVYNLLKGEYVRREVDPRTTSLTAMRKGSPVLKNDGAEAYDLGDGVLGLTFKTKMNSVDPEVIALLHQSIEKAEQEFRSLLIYNQGEHFCVGANLMLIVMASMSGEWEQIRTLIKNFQQATQRLKYAHVPVVAAPFGMALGGGLELCLGCTSVQAAAETYAGLVEVGVGLIPAGGGTLNLLWRAFESIPEGMTINTYDVVTQVFKNIALAKVATSTEEAKSFGYFRRTDGVSFDRARHLTEAKARAIGLANAGYHPPIPKAYTLPGESGIATLSMMVDTLVAGGYATEHDAKIVRKLAEVLCGGKGGSAHEVTEQEILDLECEAFLSLCGEPKSQERMQFMLQQNKPLRN